MIIPSTLKSLTKFIKIACASSSILCPVANISKSFELLFRMANFEIVNSGIDEMKNIWIVARKAKIKSNVTFADNIFEIEQLLYPGRLYTLKKVLLDDIHLFYLRYFH